MSEFHQVHLPCCDLFTLSPFTLHNILLRYHRASQCVDKYKALCQAMLSKFWVMKDTTQKLKDNLSWNLQCHYKVRFQFDTCETCS